MQNSSVLSAGDSLEYIDALSEYLGDRDPMEVLAATERSLRKAVADIDEMKRLVDSVENRDLRESLHRLAVNYEYDSILELLGSTGES